MYRFSRGTLVRVDGPASVRILNGKVHVMGVDYGPGGRFTVLRARRILVKVLEDSELDIVLGPEGNVEEAPMGEEVVDMWEDSLMNLDLRGVVLVMGTMDVGKTTLTVILANKALARGMRVGIIDADPGQNDLGPPTTVSSAILEGTYITHLRQLKPRRSIFVKTTSVEHVRNEVIDAVERLVNDLRSAGSDFIVVNTDGWVNGEGAVEYKYYLVEELRPSYVIIIRRSDEVDPLISKLSGRNLVVLQSLPAARVRSREDRKIHREMGYGKYLWPSRDLLLDLSRVPMVNLPIGGGIRLDINMRRLLSATMNARITYAEQFGKLVMVIGEFKEFRVRSTSWGNIVELPNDWERGILVALEDEDNYLLTLGMLRKINYDAAKAILTIPRDFEETNRIHHMRLGMIRLNDKFEEIERAHFVGKIESLIKASAPRIT